MKFNLKIAVALTIALLCAILPCAAQELRRNQMQEIAIGVNGGVGFSKVSFLHNDVYRQNELGDQTFRPGYRFGAVFRYIHQNHFGLQFEVNYTQAGWLESFHDDSGINLVNEINVQDVEISRRLEYIEIPVLAHIFFGKRRVRFFVELGPKFCFLTKYGDLEWNIPEDSRRSAILDDDPRINDEHRTVDYGLTGGLGIDVRAGKCHAIVGGRYAYNFRDIYNNDKSDVFQRSNNQLFSVSVTFLVSVANFTEKDRKR